jgi:hypothetical protein
VPSSLSIHLSLIHTCSFSCSLSNLSYSLFVLVAWDFKVSKSTLVFFSSETEGKYGFIPKHYLLNYFHKNLPACETSTFKWRLNPITINSVESDLLLGYIFSIWGATINRGTVYCGISLSSLIFDTQFCTEVRYYRSWFWWIVWIGSKIMLWKWLPVVLNVVSTVQLTPATYKSPKWTVLYSVQWQKMTFCFNYFEGKHAFRAVKYY